MLEKNLTPLERRNQLAEILERHTHLENILLHFFEALWNPEEACSFLSAEERKVLEDALAAARERRKA